MAAVCSWHQRQTPLTGGSPQLLTLLTILLGCADGCRRWCSTSPLRHRLRTLFLMLSMLSSPCATGCPQSDVALTHTTWSMCPKWLSSETRSAPVSIACAAIQASFVGMGRPLALSDAMILE